MESVKFKEHKEKNNKSTFFVLDNKGIRLGDIRWDEKLEEYVFDDGEIILNREQLLLIFEKTCGMEIRHGKNEEMTYNQLKEKYFPNDKKDCRSCVGCKLFHITAEDQSENCKYYEKRAE